jgi:putative membrane protein
VPVAHQSDLGRADCREKNPDQPMPSAPKTLRLEPRLFEPWNARRHLLKRAMMTNGFLGYNTTFMLDLVVCALVFVVPVLAASIYLVKFRRAFVWHRRLQLFLAGVLLFTVIAFEVDVQIVHGGWEKIVRHSHPDISAEGFDFAHKVLRVHLIFATSTPLLWAVTVPLALLRFGNPPAPSRHSPLHWWLGWASALDLGLTSVTGVLFYYVAFVAR